MMLHEALVVSVEPSRWSSLFNKVLKHMNSQNAPVQHWSKLDAGRNNPGRVPLPDSAETRWTTPHIGQNILARFQLQTLPSLRLYQKILTNLNSGCQSCHYMDCYKEMTWPSITTSGALSQASVAQRDSAKTRHEWRPTLGQIYRPDLSCRHCLTGIDTQTVLGRVGRVGRGSVSPVLEHCLFSGSGQNMRMLNSAVCTVLI